MTEDTEGQEPKRFFRIRTSIVESMTKLEWQKKKKAKKTQQTTDSTVTNLLQLEPLEGGKIRRIW